MTIGITSSTDTQQQLGDAIKELRADQPERARDLAHSAVDLGLDDATVWGVIALASRNMADYDAAQQAALDHEAHASIDQDEAKGSIPKPRPRAGEGVHLAGGCEGLNPLADHRFTKQAQASRLCHKTISFSR